ncbi:UDP-3-O-(3-hydroxymyristoyl)glucosamine N-acyltransferase [Hirschia litorea]|uniref:UDP-3-O-(3-hydroxymyristoyl)glucosamine N-acyltransferase n=1 Tax=Hirschia litorea TaxID=1199156 RepID=A0ABW2IHQ3_9PROT
MLDTQFYQLLPAPSIEELAVAGGASVYNKAASAKSLAAFDLAGEGDCTFLENSKNVVFEDIKASVCFSPLEFADRFPISTSVLTCDHPRWSFATSSSLIAVPLGFESNSNPVDPSVKIERRCSIAPNVVLGKSAEVGAGTTIGAGTVIWPGVRIGRNCSIGSNVTIKCTYIGDNVTIQSGAVIGEDGFGLSIGKTGAIDTPHYGRVIIQDNVSIGANTCIDRGLFGDTSLGENCKLDNQCHIAHNVTIGAHTVMAALCGIAGSTSIGIGCQFGGACSVADHVVIGNKVKLAGNSGLMSNIPDGETWGGFPAKPLKSWFRENVWLSQQVRKR